MLGGSFSAVPVGPVSTSSSVARPPRCTSPGAGVIAPSTPPLGRHLPQSHARVQHRPLPVRRDAKKASTCAVYGHHVVAPASYLRTPVYNEFIENVIYEGRGKAFQMGGYGDAFDPEETESQDGRDQFIADEDFEADNHDNSWHEDDDIYCKGESDEEDEGIDIVGEPLFIDELTQRAEAHKRKKNIHEYRKLQRKRGKKTATLAGGGDGEALKRPRGKTNSKMDDKRDAASFALHETLHGMMSQKEASDEKKQHGREEKMKQYLELQTKKFEMKEAAKKRKIGMEEASQQRHLEIEATNAATKAKEVALAIMSVDLSKMSEKTRSWFEVRQKEMFDADSLN
ncbi:Serine/threonine-protein kinase mph1 [Hordeum vulgare]|nr:Serine/threonine-protein kinase mph1 [Hordeum vulgare]